MHVSIDQYDLLTPQAHAAFLVDCSMRGVVVTARSGSRVDAYLRQDLAHRGIFARADEVDNITLWTADQTIVMEVMDAFKGVPHVNVRGFVPVTRDMLHGANVQSVTIDTGAPDIPAWLVQPVSYFFDMQPQTAVWYAGSTFTTLSLSDTLDAQDYPGALVYVRQPAAIAVA